MVGYRRNRVAGGTFFFTVTLRDRSSDVLVRHVGALRSAWRVAKVRDPHEVIAAVVLPDHVHAVIRLAGATDYSALWSDIKKGFTRRIGESSPWQPRFWEHTIRDATDLQHHIDYIHINPIKHRLVSRLADWPHSSFHRYVRDGILPLDWAGSVEGLGFGE
jgi:putative transposase